MISNYRQIDYINLAPKSDELPHCPRNLLLLQLLLLINLRCPETSPRPPKSDQSILSLPGGRLHDPCNRHPLLPQRFPFIHRVLRLDGMPLKFRRRVYLIRHSKFDCVGPSAIYRMSLSILCLFMLMMVISLCRNRLAMVINEGLFCVKYLVVSALFIGFLWIRNNVFDSYS